MGAAFWESIILTVLSEAKNLWAFANNVTGGKMRSFDELLKANDDLAAKLAAEK